LGFFFLGGAGLCVLVLGFILPDFLGKSSAILYHKIFFVL